MDEGRLVKYKEQYDFLEKYLWRLEDEEFRDMPERFKESMMCDAIQGIRTRRITSQLLTKKAFVKIFAWVLGRDVDYVKYVVIFENDKGQDYFLPNPEGTYVYPHTPFETNDAFDADPIGQQITTMGVEALFIIKDVRRKDGKHYLTIYKR